MVTAKDFMRAFDQVSSEQLVTLLESWTNRTTFTRYIKRKMMPVVAGIVGCDIEIEYRRVDVVFTSLTPSKEVRLIDGKVVVAIEHENDAGPEARDGGSRKEVAKLRDFNAPLGVLVTYIDDNRLGMLASFATIMSTLPNGSDVSDRGELLVIFGPYGMKVPTTLRWQYFEYRDGGFLELSI